MSSLLKSLSARNTPSALPVLESISLESDLLETMSLESSIEKDLNDLHIAMRMRNVLTDISPEGISVESYHGKIRLAFECFGVEEYAAIALPSMESVSAEEYSAEAEAKKRGLLGNIADTIKRLIAALIEKIKSLFTRKTMTVSVLMKQQEAAESQAREAKNDFSHFAEKEPATTAAAPKPPRPQTSTSLRLGYAEGHSVSIGFLGHTFDEVVTNAGKVADFSKKFIDEIEKACQKCVTLDRQSVTGKHSQLQNMVTNYSAEIKFSTGTNLYAAFYPGGPKVEIINGKPKDYEVRNLQQVPLDKLLAARRELIEVLGYDANKLSKFKTIIDGVRRQFEIELAKRQKVSDEQGDPKTWAEPQFTAYREADAVMRVEEAMLGFLGGSIHTPTDRLIKPALVEINRCLGLRGSLV